MRYELYADSLWLLNFVMNLFLCILTDRRLLHTATARRLVTAAAVGASCYLLPFLWSGPALPKYVLGILLAAGSMLWIAFRPASLGAWRECGIQMTLVSFLMGGLLTALFRVVPAAARVICSTPGLLAAGASAGALLLRRQRAQRQRENICRVTLCCGERRLAVNALVDSGNSLREPVSGKPVSVMDEATFRAFLGGEEGCFKGFRAVPYHSIGRTAGILEAYCIPELQIAYRGCVKSVPETYVAVSSHQTGGVKMILNPELLN